MSKVGRVTSRLMPVLLVMLLAAPSTAPGGKPEKKKSDLIPAEVQIVTAPQEFGSITTLGVTHDGGSMYVDHSLGGDPCVAAVVLSDGRLNFRVIPLDLGGYGVSPDCSSPNSETRYVKIDFSVRTDNGPDLCKDLNAGPIAGELDRQGSCAVLKWPQAYSRTFVLGIPKMFSGGLKKVGDTTFSDGWININGVPDTEDGTGYTLDYQDKLLIELLDPATGSRSASTAGLHEATLLMRVGGTGRRIKIGTFNVPLTVIATPCPGC